MGGPDTRREEAILRAKMGAGHARTCPVVDIVSKPLSRWQHQFGADSDWGSLGGGAHWRYLANAAAMRP